jgi:histidine triad (HIT) family protein
MNCLFCKISSGEIPSKKVFENENIVAFNDLYPQSKIHLLFIHKNHSHDLTDLMTVNSKQVEEIFKAIVEHTQSDKIFSEGFRVVNNQGKNAGQTVFHTHFHVLAGEELGRFGS